MRLIASGVWIGLRNSPNELQSLCAERCTSGWQGKYEDQIVKDYGIGGDRGVGQYNSPKPSMSEASEKACMEGSRKPSGHIIRRKSPLSRQPRPQAFRNFKALLVMYGATLELQRLNHALRCFPIGLLPQLSLRAATRIQWFCLRQDERA